MITVRDLLECMIDIDVEVNLTHKLGKVEYFWDGKWINYEGGTKVFEHNFTDKTLEQIMEEVNAYSVQHNLEELLSEEQEYVPDDGDVSGVDKIESYEKAENETTNDTKEK